MAREYLLTTDDAARWRAALPADECVLGSVEYVRACERQTGCPARLFVVETETARVAYPYLLRRVLDLPFAAGLGKELWDTFTPEYTGPVGIGPAGELEALRFADRFGRHCREQGVVAEFAHLSPWNVAPGATEPGCVEPNREIVFADLTLDEGRLWSASLNSDGRRQTKQAQKAGVRVRRAVSADDVREFHRLYTATMERRQAQGRYYFPAGYFLELLEALPGHCFYALAEYQGRVVAGGLFFQDRTDVYWHLSACDREFAHVRPVNAYVFETMRGLLRQGRRRMTLGGGHQPGDGVFHFKANFSPLRARFCTYKRVHDAEAYGALLTAWARHHDEPPRGDFFPAYRCARRPPD